MKNKYVVTSALIILLLMSGGALANDKYRWTVEIRGYNGKCVDVRGASKANGAVAQIYGCAVVPQQVWHFHENGLIQSTHSYKCLSVNSNDGFVYLNTCNPKDRNQIWVTKGIHTIPQRPGVGEPGAIVHSSGKCMDIAGPNGSDGTRVQVWDCVGVDNQKFAVVKDFRLSEDFDKRWIEKINNDSMCFSESSCNRLQYLLGIRKALVKRHGTGSGSSYYLNYNDLGAMLMSISLSWGDLSTTEKAYLWSSIADESTHNGKQWTTVLGNSLPVRNRSFHIDYRIRLGTPYSHRYIRDSWISSSTYKHSVVKFTDGVHGPLTYLSPQQAFTKIWKKEKSDAQRWNTPFWINEGDAEASLRTYITFRDFHRFGNNFHQFAYAWNGLMRKDGENWCRKRIYDEYCGAIELGPYNKP